jgi:hypothetical protein
MSPTTAIWGDLHEEFTLQRAERGLSNAALWYARQVALSMPMLLSPRPLAILLPLLALDRLWCLVYSLIPMRDGLDRAPGFLAANIAVACWCAVLSRASAPSAAAATALAVLLAVSAQPPLYVVSALLCVTAASHLATRKRSLS